MSLLDDLEAPAPPEVRGSTCSVAGALIGLPDDERAAVQAAIESKPYRLTHNELARRLRMHGVRIAAHSIGRHRRQDCRCR